MQYHQKGMGYNFDIKYLELLIYPFNSEKKKFCVLKMVLNFQT